jgi:surface antigen
MGLISYVRRGGTRRENLGDAVGNALDSTARGSQVNDALRSVEDFDLNHPYASGAALWVVADGFANNFESSDAMISASMDMGDASEWAEVAEEFPLTEVPANVGDMFFDSVQGSMGYIQDSAGLEDDNLDIFYIGTEAVEKLAAVAELPFEYVSDPGESINDISQGQFPTGEDNEVYNQDLGGYVQDVLGLDGGAVEATEDVGSGPDGAADTTQAPEQTTTAEAPAETTVAPGTDYNFAETFDASDRQALNEFFQDVGSVDSLDVEWAGGDSGSGKYILEATNEAGETYAFDLVENGAYDGVSYDIDGNEIQDVVQARADGEVWDLFDESDYIPNRD